MTRDHRTTTITTASPAVAAYLAAKAATKPLDDTAAGAICRKYGEKMMARLADDGGDLLPRDAFARGWELACAYQRGGEEAAEAAYQRSKTRYGYTPNPEAGAVRQSPRTPR